MMMYDPPKLRGSIYGILEGGVLPGGDILQTMPKEDELISPKVPEIAPVLFKYLMQK